MKYLLGELLMLPLHPEQGHWAEGGARVSWEGTYMPMMHRPPRGEVTNHAGSGKSALTGRRRHHSTLLWPMAGHRHRAPAGAHCHVPPALIVLGARHHGSPEETSTHSQVSAAQSAQRGQEPAPSRLAAATDQEVGAVSTTLQGLSGAGEV